MQVTRGALPLSYRRTLARRAGFEPATSALWSAGESNPDWQTASLLSSRWTSTPSSGRRPPLDDHAMRTRGLGSNQRFRPGGDGGNRTLVSAMRTPRPPAGRRPRGVPAEAALHSGWPHALTLMWTARESNPPRVACKASLHPSAQPWRWSSRGQLSRRACVRPSSGRQESNLRGPGSRPGGQPLTHAQLG